MLGTIITGCLIAWLLTRRATWEVIRELAIIGSWLALVAFVFVAMA